MLSFLIRQTFFFLFYQTNDIFQHFIIRKNCVVFFYKRYLSRQSWLVLTIWKTWIMKLRVSDWQSESFYKIFLYQTNNIFTFCRHILWKSLIQHKNNSSKAFSPADKVSWEEETFMVNNIFSPIISTSLSSSSSSLPPPYGWRTLTRSSLGRSQHFDSRLNLISLFK